MADSGNSEMVERVARAICNRRMPKPAYDSDAFDNLKSWAEQGGPFFEESKAELAEFYADARAAIEAIMAGQFVEYRITSPDGELFAETAGTPAAAFAEAQHYAMQEPGAVIEQVVCLPALSPSLKEQERT